MMVDLDNFKRVNDSLGHQAGDTVLCEISKRLQACIRKSDTVGRMVETNLLCCSPIFAPTKMPMKSPRSFWPPSRNLFASESTRYCYREHRHQLLSGCDDVDSLFKNADFAMYRVKKQRRKRLTSLYAWNRHAGPAAVADESAMRNALEAREFEFSINRRSPSPTAASWRRILLRWNSSEFGLVGPNTFIPLAEETGLIVPSRRLHVASLCRTEAGPIRRSTR